ncbi:MAG: hypothetical protein M3Q58_06835 [Bacteroidota bacterium]|nr:hypothetical protein [Bacteroidota bacterium]
MRIYKNLELILSSVSICFLLSLIGCGPEIESRKKNFIVVLDLSDRIVNNNQIQNDIDDILNIRRLFIAIAKNELETSDDSRISENTFKIKIVPQKNIKQEYNKELEALLIDFTGVNDNEPEKLQQIFKKDAEKNYKTKLEELFNKARFSENKKNYDGANFYKYFNEDFEKHLLNGADNYAFLITDGYMYFETDVNATGTQGTFTNMSHLKKNSKIENSNWLIDYEKKDLKMLPVKKNFSNDSCMVFIMQIKPEETNQNEYDFINNVWKNWFSEMGIYKVKTYKTSDSPSNIKLIEKLIMGSEFFNIKPALSKENKKEIIVKTVPVIEKKALPKVNNGTIASNELQELTSLLNACESISNVNKKTLFFLEKLIVKGEEIREYPEIKLRYCVLVETALANLKNIIPEEKSNKDFISFCNKRNDLSYELKKCGRKTDSKITVELNLICE